MPFITLGEPTELQIKVPTQGTTSWGNTMQKDTFLKIALHDHTGSGGNGKQLTGGAIAVDTINGTKILLNNDEYLRAQNSIPDANIDILKINTSDLLELGASLNNLEIKNNTYITGTDQVGTGSINMLKVDTNDEIAVGATLANLDLKSNVYLTSNSVNVTKVDTLSRVDIADGNLVLKGTDSIADAQLVTTLPNCPVASSGEALFVYYKLVRGALRQFGQLVIDEDNSGIIEELYGDDCGVTFTESAGAIQAASTSTGTAITMTYTIIKL